MASRYKQRLDGEWVVWPGGLHLVACCDCGLVHLMRARTLKNGTIEVQATRLNRHTAARRREMKKRQNRSK
jgi:hypothetical protein